MDEQMANVGSEVVIDLGMESVNEEQEQQLKVQTSEIEVQAKGIIVNSDDTFKAAADFGKVIKRQTATIKSCPFKCSRYSFCGYFPRSLIAVSINALKILNSFCRRVDSSLCRAILSCPSGISLIRPCIWCAR